MFDWAPGGILDRLAEVVECPRGHIMVNASHTHGGPSAGEKYTDWLYDQVLEGTRHPGSSNRPPRSSRAIPWSPGTGVGPRSVSATAGCFPFIPKASSGSSAIASRAGRLGRKAPCSACSRDYRQSSPRPQREWWIGGKVPKHRDGSSNLSGQPDDDREVDRRGLFARSHDARRSPPRCRVGPRAVPRTDRDARAA